MCLLTEPTRLNTDLKKQYLCFLLETANPWHLHCRLHTWFIHTVDFLFVFHFPSESSSCCRSPFTETVAWIVLTDAKWYQRKFNPAWQKQRVKPLVSLHHRFSIFIAQPATVSCKYSHRFFSAKINHASASDIFRLEYKTTGKYKSRKWDKSTTALWCCTHYPLLKNHTGFRFYVA